MIAIADSDTASLFNQFEKALKGVAHIRVSRCFSRIGVLQQTRFFFLSVVLVLPSSWIGASQLVSSPLVELPS